MLEEYYGWDFDPKKVKSPQVGREEREEVEEIYIDAEDHGTMQKNRIFCITVRVDYKRPFYSVVNVHRWSNSHEYTVGQKTVWKLCSIVEDLVHKEGKGQILLSGCGWTYYPE